MIHSSPETTQLHGIFKELDQSKEGFITKAQFKSYIEKQPRNLEDYIIDELFSMLPDQKMNQQAFVTYIMGYRMKLQTFALAKFSIQKNLAKHVAASPPSGVNEIRKNKLKFNVASKKHLTADQKHKLMFAIGLDQKGQALKFQQLQKILGRKPHSIVGLIKFKVDGAEEEIRQGLEIVIQKAKGTISELDQQLFRILDLFQFSVKAHNGHIYIFVEANHVFLLNLVGFFHEFIQSLNPEAVFTLSALIQSNYFKDFLKEGSEKKMEDLELQLQLDIDNESLKKIKQIAGAQTQFNTESQQNTGALFLLFKQVSLEASFSNSQKLFNHFGLGQSISNSKSILSSLKEMSIIDTLEGFIPQSVQLIENLKKHGKSEGQISISFGDLFFKLEFNIQIEGAFDLI